MGTLTRLWFLKQGVTGDFLMTESDQTLFSRDIIPPESDCSRLSQHKALLAK